MGKITVLLALLFATVAGYAQFVPVLNDNGPAQVKTYAVLPDLGYTLDKVCTDSSLQFVTGDSLRLAKASCFWISVAVVNPSHYDEPYNVYVYPALNNTLYSFDANSHHWIGQQTGIYASNDRHRRGSCRNAMPFIAQKKAETILYIKADLRAVHQVKA